MIITMERIEPLHAWKRKYIFILSYLIISRGLYIVYPIYPIYNQELELGDTRPFYSELFSDDQFANLVHTKTP